MVIAVLWSRISLILVGPEPQRDTAPALNLKYNIGKIYKKVINCHSFF
jgi:hypothetical protein